MASTEEKTDTFASRLRLLGLMLVGITICIIGTSWAGHPALWLPAFGFATSLSMCVHTEWKWRDKVWFWVVVLAITTIDLTLLTGIPWPEDWGRSRGKLALWLIALGNISAFGSAFWVTRRLLEGKSAPEPTLCRACKQEVATNALRCSHCGEWKPGPLPSWPLLIGFGPAILMMLGMAFMIDWYAPENQEPAPAMEDYVAGQEVTDALHRSVVRTLLRAKDFPCGKLTVHSQGGAQWMAQCDARGVMRRYVVYPKTSVVRACPLSPDESCE